eukprot:TRINITY_DN14769_c0_g1_i1.p1 TRINITY_DN14769_c0_g1~~TRINITY_DN14769_c0_g1_i1.p1  ORF type:complete len:264 (-),score=40.15 TRINITY_DN14769_c0_g1_i1:2-733(-)
MQSMESVELLLEEIKQGFIEILGKNLVGTYVHGSIAMGCFSWNSSDIDFLVIVQSELSISDKREVYKFLIETSKKAPPKGLEMSILLRSSIEKFKHPTPYELHFSEDYFKEHKGDEASMYAGGLDPDLAGHLTIVRERGFCLMGEPINSLFKKPIPEEAYLASILNDINDIYTHFAKNPAYYILNTCRVLAYLETAAITSKKEGAEWALQALPKQLSLIHISEPTRPLYISYAVFCLKKKKKK